MNSVFNQNSFYLICFPDCCVEVSEIFIFLRWPFSRIHFNFSCLFQTRYYISSREAGAKYFNTWTRSHRAIENNLHWTLDVVFGEDQSRKRKGNAAQNFNTIRKIVIVLLVNEQHWKASKKRKRLKALQNHHYRETLLKI
jgi:hypothetical protein